MDKLKRSCLSVSFRNCPVVRDLHSNQFERARSLASRNARDDSALFSARNLHSGDHADEASITGTCRGLFWLFLLPFFFPLSWMKLLCLQRLYGLTRLILQAVLLLFSLRC